MIYYINLTKALTNALVCLFGRRMKIISLIFIMITISNCFSQKVINERFSAKDEKCYIQIIVENHQANLGSFYNGTKNNPVPGLGGNTNSITYYVYGFDKDEFQLNIELTDNIKYGDDYISIEEWEVMIEDEINNSSQKIFRNNKFSKNVKINKRNREKNCNEIMKITIYIHKISIGNHVQSGTVYLNLFFSITSLS